jgi:hypothetical protein
MRIPRMISMSASRTRIRASSRRSVGQLAATGQWREQADRDKGKAKAKQLDE